MIYLEFEKYRDKFLSVQQIFNNVLIEQEQLFTRTQPNAIRYDKEKVSGGGGGNMLENYVISLEDRQIHEKLSMLRQLLDDREKLLRQKESELRQSTNKYDKIYVLKYLDGYSISRVADKLNYSKSQIYRMLGKMNKMRQNANLHVL